MRDTNSHNPPPSGVGLMRLLRAPAPPGTSAVLACLLVAFVATLFLGVWRRPETTQGQDLHRLALCLGRYKHAHTHADTLKVNDWMPDGYDRYANPLGPQCRDIVNIRRVQD